MVDPRLSATAQAASLHLKITPGADAALANGLLHILIRDGLIDHDYIAARTEGFGQVKSLAASYWPDRVERITGIPEAQLVRAAHALGEARMVMILTARGVEQHAQGVNNTLAYINLALALRLPGRPFSGYGAITGQGNGQGGREHGQKADQSDDGPRAGALPNRRANAARGKAEVTLASRRGVAQFKVKVTAGIREDTVFAPFHWGGESSVNRLTNPALDPVSRMPEFKVCVVEGELIAVFRERGGAVFAMQAKCSHRDGALADGLIGGGRIICPLHAFKFELSTGRPLGNDCPALKTYRVSVNERGEILLGLSR